MVGLCAAAVMYTPLPLAAQQQSCSGGDEVKVNVRSPEEGQTYRSAVPLRFFVTQENCDVAFTVVIDGHEYAPAEDGTRKYVPVRGRAAGCRSGLPVRQGEVDLSAGEHRLRISGCPQGTNVAHAFGSPGVVRFGVEDASAQPLPDTGIQVVPAGGALTAVLFGVVLLRRMRH